jgi:Leucine-rich repeat (LRR) protein
MRNKITTLTLLVLLVITLITQPVFAEQTDAKDNSPSEGRIVSFPKGRSIGYLWIQDEGIVNIPYALFFSYSISTEDDQWDLFGPAQGDIVVPPGKRLSLNITKNNWKDLSPLKNLKPNDLYQLTIYGGLTAITNPNDTCMPHIAHLTGLKHLELQWSHISNKGLQYIKGFDSLEYLYLPERINDSTLIFVSQLKSLKGLYISGTAQITNEGLAPLQHLPNLEEISIDGLNKINTMSLCYLSKIPSLKKLSIIGKKVTDDGLIYLKDFPQLKMLMLGNTEITDSGLQFFSNLQKLEDLDLYNTNVTDEGIPHLVPLKSLRQLTLGKHPLSKKEPITEKAAAYLAQIQTLEYLDLESITATDYALSELSKLPNLKSLYASTGRSGKPITDQGLNHLSKIKSLELLRINTKAGTDEGLAALAQLPNLKKLSLTCPKITDKGLSKIANMKNLQKLSLSVSRYDYPELTFITISDLGCLNEMTNLKSLVLTGVIQDGSGLNISQLRNLEKLSISCKSSFEKRGKSVFPIYQSFTDKDLACLANLKNLRSLILHGSESITDKGLVHLKDLTKLKTLHLDEASLTGQGLIHLQNLTNLQSLYLAGTSLDQGLAYIKNLKKLNELCISGDFTEKGIQHLKELKSLQTLYLHPDYGIPNRAIRDLKNSLPYLSRFQLMTK